MCVLAWVKLILQVVEDKDAQTDSLFELHEHTMARFIVNELVNLNIHVNFIYIINIYTKL